MKTKYAVCTERFEYILKKYDTPEEAFHNRDDYNYDNAGRLFDTIEEARECLKSIEVSSFKFSSPIGMCVEAKVAFIEEGSYDQDEEGKWEFICGGDIWDFKCEVPNKD